MKYIVIGGTGLLGIALQKAIKQNGDICITVARKNADFCIDVKDDSKLKALIEDQKPDVVINACAIVNHEICDFRDHFITTAFIPDFLYLGCTHYLFIKNVFKSFFQVEKKKMFYLKKSPGE